MTIALAIIGGIVIILGAAARIPPAAAAFLRACIPLITALREVRDTLRPAREIAEEQTPEDHGEIQNRTPLRSEDLG